MFRAIRKKKNALNLEATYALLLSSRRGILAVNGDDGYPYAIPINYVYDKDAQKIYFHGARTGHKVNALHACNQVCFTVYGNENRQRRTLGTLRAKRCCLWQMPFGCRWRKSNHAAKETRHEILSQRTDGGCRNCSCRKSSTDF